MLTVTELQEIMDEGIAETAEKKCDSRVYSYLRPIKYDVVSKDKWDTVETNSSLHFSS